VEDLQRRQRPVERACIQVTVGATSGLDLVCRALFASGDQVIVLAPYWPLIRGIVSASGAEPVELPFFTELHKPGFDLRQALESVVTPRTAGLYVNQPHNPTGAVLDDPHLEILAEFAETHQLWVLSDEAYEHLSFTDRAPPALWTHPRLRTRTLAAHTFSKTFGLAGARVGFVHGPRDALQAVSGLQTFATYGAARPMQVAVARALRSHEGSDWVEAARARYRKAAERTAQALGMPTPRSGTFAFFELTPYLREGEAPQQWLERCARAGVVLTPGAVTGRAYENWARLCFTSVPPSTLDRALTVLDRVVRDR
jgi:N-succinyldiaminopimelate aminotransferase